MIYTIKNKKLIYKKYIITIKSMKENKFKNFKQNKII